MNDSNENLFDDIDNAKVHSSRLVADENWKLCLWNNPLYKDTSTQDKYSNFTITFQGKDYHFIKSIVCQLCRTLNRASEGDPEMSSLSVNKNYDPLLFQKCMALLAGCPLVEVTKAERISFTDIILELGIDSDEFQKRIFSYLVSSIDNDNVLQIADLGLRHSKQELLEPALQNLKEKYNYQPLKNLANVCQISRETLELIITTHNIERVSAKQAGQQIVDTFLNAFQVHNLVNAYCRENSHLFKSDEERDAFTDKLISSLDFEEQISGVQDTKTGGKKTIAEFNNIADLLTLQLDKVLKKIDYFEKNEKKKDSEISLLKQRIALMELAIEKQEIKNLSVFVDRYKSVTKGPSNFGWAQTNKIDVVAFTVSKNIRLTGVSVYLPHTNPKKTIPEAQPLQTSTMPDPKQKGKKDLKDQKAIKQSVMPTKQVPIDQSKIGLQSQINPNEPTTLKGTITIIEGDKLGGIVLAEQKFEVAYTHEPGKGDLAIQRVSFDHVVKVKPHQWYIIVQKAFGPQTFYGEGGMDSVTQGDTCFVFKSVENIIDNNGTDSAKGMIPRLYYCA